MSACHHSLREASPFRGRRKGGWPVSRPIPCAGIASIKLLVQVTNKLLKFSARAKTHSLESNGFALCDKLI